MHPPSSGARLSHSIAVLAGSWAPRRSRRPNDGQVVLLQDAVFIEDQHEVIAHILPPGYVRIGLLYDEPAFVTAQAVGKNAVVFKCGIRLAQTRHDILTCHRLLVEENQEVTSAA